MVVESGLIYTCDFLTRFNIVLVTWFTSKLLKCVGSHNNLYKISLAIHIHSAVKKSELE